MLDLHYSLEVKCSKKVADVRSNIPFSLLPFPVRNVRAELTALASHFIP